MVSNPKHQALRGNTTRPATRGVAETRRLDITDKMASDMLYEGRELVKRRENGVKFTLDVPKWHSAISRSDLMFSLTILAPIYGLEVDNYADDVFTFIKVSGSDHGRAITPASEEKVFPAMFRA